MFLFFLFPSLTPHLVRCLLVWTISLPFNIVERPSQTKHFSVRYSSVCCTFDELKWTLIWTKTFFSGCNHSRSPSLSLLPQAEHRPRPFSPGAARHHPTVPQAALKAQELHVVRLDEPCPGNSQGVTPYVKRVKLSSDRTQAHRHTRTQAKVNSSCINKPLPGGHTVVHTAAIQVGHDIGSNCWA